MGGDPGAIVIRPVSRALVVVVLLTIVPAGARAAVCDGPAHRMVEPLLGEWVEFEITDEGERPIGRLKVVPIAGGCAFSQQFESADSSFGFVSLATVEAGSEAWHETILFSTGRTVEYRWRAAGDEVVFDRLDEDGVRRKRLRATAIGADAFVVLEELSSDGGQSWEVVERTPTRRVPSERRSSATTLAYCTPHGEFVVEFRPQRVVGRYVIAPKGIDGTFSGALDGRRVRGRWSDRDGAGDIVIDFTDDWASFSADYRNDAEPEVWHRGWLGALRPPAGAAAFDRDGTTFRCDP